MTFKGINNVGRIIISGIFLLMALQTSAQQGKLPPFSIMQPGGKIFRAQQLPLGKPIVVIYFDPGCDHCETMMTTLMAKAQDFKNASIALITYVPVSEVLKFEKKYGLRNHENMYTGTEATTFFVKNYYRITSMPFMALYTKNGDLVKEYRTEGAIPALSKQLSGLN